MPSSTQFQPMLKTTTHRACEIRKDLAVAVPRDLLQEIQREQDLGGWPRGSYLSITNLQKWRHESGGDDRDFLDHARRCHLVPTDSWLLMFPFTGVGRWEFLLVCVQKAAAYVDPSLLGGGNDVLPSATALSYIRQLTKIVSPVNEAPLPRRIEESPREGPFIGKRFWIDNDGELDLAVAALRLYDRMLVTLWDRVYGKLHTNIRQDASNALELLRPTDGTLHAAIEGAVSKYLESEIKKDLGGPFATDAHERKAVVLGSFDTWSYMDFVARLLADTGWTVNTSRFVYRKYSDEVQRVETRHVPSFADRTERMSQLLDQIIVESKVAIVCLSTSAAHFIEIEWLSQKDKPTVGIAFVRETQRADDNCPYLKKADHEGLPTQCDAHGLRAWDCIELNKNHFCPFISQDISKNILEYFTSERSNQRFFAIENLTHLPALLAQALKTIGVNSPPQSQGVTSVDFARNEDWEEMYYRGGVEMAIEAACSVAFYSGKHIVWKFPARSTRLIQLAYQGLRGRQLLPRLVSEQELLSIVETGTDSESNRITATFPTRVDPRVATIRTMVEPVDE